MAVFSAALPIIVNLPSKPVILVFASEFDAFEPFENNMNSFSRLGKHGVDRDAHPDVARVFQELVLVSHFHQLLNYEPVVRILTNGLLNGVLDFVAQLEEIVFTEFLFLVEHSGLVGRRVSNCPSECGDHRFLGGTRF